MQSFIQDLEKRINPEKSRKFDIHLLEKKISGLMETGNLPLFRRPDGTVRLSVIGSNGKGSTAFYLSGLLSEKFKTGLYTSPHLHTVLERIRINQEMLAEEKFNEYYFMLLEILNHQEDFSYFEILTLLSIYIFNQEKCAFQIYEAGIGGRFDATRAACPSMVALTSVSLEHVSVLGGTVEKILDEKLAIMDAYTEHFFYPSTLAVADKIVEEKVRSIHPEIQIHKFDLDKSILRNNYLRYNFRYAEFILEQTGRNLPEQADFYNVPGRLERTDLILNGRPLHVIYDSAHNPEAVNLLMDNLAGDSTLDLSRIAVFFGFLPDKDAVSCLKILQKYSPAVTVQITGNGFTDQVTAEYSVDVQNIEEILSKLLEENKIHCILLTGSTRLYDIFLEFKKRFLKETEQIKSTG